jgi:hypothetical protein
VLRQLDVLIRDVLVRDLVAITSDAQVRFQPPDDTLRTDVSNLNQPALDVYLVDVREHRKLRSNERMRTFDNGFVFAERFPDRLDCHYLITAWSPTPPAPGLEPTLDEHALLYDAAVALVNSAPLNPARTYAPASARLAAWPARFRDYDLPMSLVPPDGLAKLSEFWTTMGATMRWKPALYLIVTLPLVLVRENEGPMVTTRFADYRRWDAPEAAEMLLQIGGTVLRDAGGGAFVPVSDAWVQIETLGGVTLQHVQTNELGRFTFARLRESQYRLRTTALGLGQQVRVVDVPSSSGEYDLRFP